MFILSCREERVPMLSSRSTQCNSINSPDLAAVWISLEIDQSTLYFHVSLDTSMEAAIIVLMQMEAHVIEDQLKCGDTKCFVLPFVHSPLCAAIYRDISRTSYFSL